MISIQDRIKTYQDRIERDEKYADKYLKLMSESYDSMIKFCKAFGGPPFETRDYLYNKKMYKFMTRRIRNNQKKVKFLQKEYL